MDTLHLGAYNTEYVKEVLLSWEKYWRTEYVATTVVRKSNPHLDMIMWSVHVGVLRLMEGGIIYVDLLPIALMTTPNYPFSTRKDMNQNRSMRLFFATLLVEWAGYLHDNKLLKSFYWKRSGVIKPRFRVLMSNARSGNGFCHSPAGILLSECPSNTDDSMAFRYRL